LKVIIGLFLVAFLATTSAFAEKPVFPIAVIDYYPHTQNVPQKVIDHAKYVISERPEHWPNSKTFRYFTITDTRNLIEAVGRAEALNYVQRTSYPLSFEVGSRTAYVLAGDPLPVYWNTSGPSAYDSNGRMYYDYMVNEWDRLAISVSEPMTISYLLGVLEEWQDGWDAIFFDNATNTFYNVNLASEYVASDESTVIPPNLVLNSAEEKSRRNLGLQQLNLARGGIDLFNGAGDGNRPSMYEFRGSSPARRTDAIPDANMNGILQVPHQANLANDLEGHVAYQVCNANIRQQVPYAVHLGNFGYFGDGKDWIDYWSDDMLWTADTSTVAILVDDDNKMAVRLGNKIYATNIATRWYANPPGEDWASPWGTIKAGSGMIVDIDSPPAPEEWRPGVSSALFKIRMALADLQGAVELGMPNGDYFFQELWDYQDSLSYLEEN